MRTLTSDDTPGSCIVTPYTASAASVVVRGLCVMTMNCVFVLNSVEHAHEPADVRVVERRVHLVEQAERARLGEEDAEQQRQRDERALAARQQVDALRALAARRRVDLDVAVERRLGVLQPQVALAAAEQRHEDLPEVLAHLHERLQEHLARRGVDLADGLLQRVLARR